MIRKGNSFKKMEFKMDGTIYKCQLRFWDIKEESYKVFHDTVSVSGNAYKSKPEIMFFTIIIDKYGDYFAKEIKTGHIFPIIYYDGNKLRCTRIRTKIYYAVDVDDIAQPRQEEIDSYKCLDCWEEYYNSNLYKELPFFPSEETTLIVEQPSELENNPQADSVEEADKPSYSIDPFFQEYAIIQKLLAEVKSYDESKYQEFANALEDISNGKISPYCMSSVNYPFTVQSLNFMQLCKLEFAIQFYIKEHSTEIILIKLFNYFNQFDKKQFYLHEFMSMMSSTAQFFMETKLQLSFAEKKKLVTFIFHYYEAVIQKYPQLKSQILETAEYSYFNQMYQIIQVENCPSIDTIPKEK